MTLTQTELNGLIAAIRAAARHEIMPRFRRLGAGDISAKTDPTDLVTVADRAAEVRIAEAVRRLMPDAAIIGEEAVADDPALLDTLADARRAVIVDPIDGTWNFASGLAVFGVILAVVIDGETRAGVLYDPVMDDWIVARKGRGTWFCRPGEAPVRLHGPPPRTRQTAQAFVPLFLYSQAEKRRLAATLPDWGRVTSLRCSCHEYRMLALGHADLITAPRPRPWDHAAGVLVARECGGAAWADGAGYVPATPCDHLVVIANRQAELSPHTAFR